MKEVRFLVVGAGFAGASTAFHLARMGAKGVLVTEREEAAGRNSSGLNAAMVTQTGADPAVEDMARRGAEFIRRPPDGWPGRLGFAATGALFLASGERLRASEGAAERARAAGLEAEVRSGEWARARHALLEGNPAEGALWCPSDGVVDIQGLLRGFLDGAQALGAELWLGCALQSIRPGGGGAFVAETSRGPVRAECLVNAAGAWSGAVAAMAGAAQPPLRPCRRHLFRTGPLAWVREDWPIAWDVDEGCYFRPEAGGLLLSPCDEDEHPPALPEADASVRERLQEKLGRRFPRLQWMRYTANWACLRTLTPDDRFAIGWDPGVPGFFWVAGLGGHGATCAGAVGDVAARLLLGGEDPWGLAGAFSLGRFRRPVS
ncbi:MAG: FAD-dependent oxidoreductase [Nitrospinota bacterium]